MYIMKQKNKHIKQVAKIISNDACRLLHRTVEDHNNLANSKEVLKYGVEFWICLQKANPWSA